MLNDFLSRRGVRDASTIHLVTPMPKPIPVSDDVSDAIIGLLDERDIKRTHMRHGSRASTRRAGLRT